MCVCEAQPDSRRDLPLLCLIANGGFKLPFVPKPRFITETPCSLEPEFLRLFAQRAEICWDISLFDLVVSFVAVRNGPGLLCSRPFFWKGFVLHKFAGITRVISAPLCAARPLRAIL